MDQEQQQQEEEKDEMGFWTACPYCYVLYEYPCEYDDCCLRCQNCERAFHAAALPQLPPLVPGKEAYFCCWAYFPLGFSTPNPPVQRRPRKYPRVM